MVTRAQLLSLGLSYHAIDSRVKAGRLYVVHRGVYLLGHRAASERWREMAAVLAYGEGAVVSHRSAAQLWSLLAYPAQRRPIDVTVQGNPSVRPGILLHRVMRLHPRDVRSCNRIPITTPARTVLDLAGQGSYREFEQAFAEARVRRLVNRHQLMAMLERNRRRPGAGVLRAMLVGDSTPALTRSEAEERFLELVRSAGLPPSETNVRLGAHEVDFLWPKERLVVEVDGFQFHSSRAAFERDRLRDAELQARGFRVIRVTWRQLADQPEAMMARIARALTAQTL